MKSINITLGIVIAAASISAFATTPSMTLAQKAAAIQTARNAANQAMIQQNNAVQTYNNQRQNLSLAGLQQIQSMFTNSQNVFKQTAATISSVQNAVIAPTLQPLTIPVAVAAPKPVQPTPINYAPVAPPANVAAPAIINPQPINQAPTLNVAPPVMTPVASTVVTPPITNPQPVKPAPIINAPSYVAPVAPATQPTISPGAYRAVVASKQASLFAPPAPAVAVPQPLAQQAPATKTLVAVVPNTAVSTQVSNIIPPVTVANPQPVANAPQIVTVSSIVKGTDGANGVDGKDGKDGTNGITTTITKVDTATQAKVAANSATITSTANHSAAVAKDLDAVKSSMQAMNRSTNSRFKALSKEIDNNKKHANAGISGAMAMAGLPQVQTNQKVMFSAGAATYEGESALAVGGSVNFNDHVIGKVSFSTDTAENMGASVGLGIGF